SHHSARRRARVERFKSRASHNCLDVGRAVNVQAALAIHPGNAFECIPVPLCPRGSAMSTSFMKVASVVAGSLLAIACADSAITSPSSSTPMVATSASFGKNPGAGRGGKGGNGGGGGGGAANCGQPLVTFAHGAQFSQACS